MNPPPSILTKRSFILFIPYFAFRLAISCTAKFRLELSASPDGPWQTIVLDRTFFVQIKERDLWKIVKENIEKRMKEQGRAEDDLVAHPNWIEDPNLEDYD